MIGYPGIFIEIKFNPLLSPGYIITTVLHISFTISHALIHFSSHDKLLLEKGEISQSEFVLESGINPRQSSIICYEIYTQGDFLQMIFHNFQTLRNSFFILQMYNPGLESNRKLNPSLNRNGKGSPIVNRTKSELLFFLEVHNNQN